jgi:FkbM family methyltransferase
MIGLLSWRIKSRIETALQGLPMFQNLLTKFVDNLPEDVFFVEIGANDGIDFDPIYQAVIKKKWSGVYIEPQKSVFLKLQSNFHGRENIFFENIAITKEEMFVDLFSPNEEITNGNSLIASMHMNKGVLRHFTESELRKETVQGKPFQYIIDKYELKNKKRTLLLIDVEGFEKEVIESINFNTYKPDYLIFEHAHLTYDIHREINASLVDVGYKIYLDKMDTLAILISK